MNTLSGDEVAIPPAAVSIKLITRMLIRAFSDVEKPFLFSDLAAFVRFLFHAMYIVSILYICT